jgi:hypothetical protein
VRQCSFEDLPIIIIIIDQIADFVFHTGKFLFKTWNKIFLSCQHITCENDWLVNKLLSGYIKFL